MNDKIGFRKILDDTKHFSTDGEYRNVCEHGGLWKLIEDQWQWDSIQLAMLKPVCAVHSSVLACKYLGKKVKGVDRLKRNASGL